LPRTIDEQAWGQPYAPATNQWAWGSTAQILNNMVVLASAYDISLENKYRDGVVEGWTSSSAATR
jgi:endoglucanase